MRRMNRDNEFGDISALLMSKLQTLESKVDALNQDRVTRTDFENLRSDISNRYVSRDTYEVRHAALIERDTQLELTHKTDIKDLRDIIEKAIAQREKEIEQLEHKIEQQHEIQLSAKDRWWIRFSQVVGFVSVLLFILEYIIQHVKVQ